MPPTPRLAAPSAEACRRVATLVEAAADVRARAAAAAQAGWCGPARDRFDAELAALQREAAHLAADLRSRAAAIDAAIDAAATDAHPR